MKCSTILLISINILFLIISVLTVTSGSIVQYLFGQYYYILENHTGVSVFPTLWIAAGCFLLLVSMFGILVSSGQSTILINTYAILLSLVLVLHVATAISALMLGVCRSKEIVSDTLTAFVHSYEYNTMLRQTMDWTQYKYQCCGNNGPDDWNNYVKSVKVPDILATTPTENSTSTLTAANENVNAMPASCCFPDSDYTNFRCDKYYPNGCSTFVQDILSTNVMIASFLALGMALLDLLGAIVAFLISKSLRRVREIEADYSQLGVKNSYR
ncbi:CD63 antigen-like [Bradysia coprophila]|uniref:CD63 antigen-like n=1 Tax=Bradysia coprophila TaxID=38358 RepID=UPI00187DA283|nr:CD63 antigen-like [Bradysia coprophila]